MDQHKPPERSSLADLIAALFLTLLVCVYLFGITAFAVISQADIDNRAVTDGDVATILIVPAVGGLVVAAFVITRWRSGWSCIW